MPQSLTTAVENNFTKGLITESTGLNFPENAATDCDNCEFTLVGDVTRRLGINNEQHFSVFFNDRSNSGLNSYKWNNAGGDGLSQIVVRQVGRRLYFYLSSASTTSAPLSNQLLGVSPLDFSGFTAVGAVFNDNSECQFSDGNGYLFIYHPSCDPMYAVYTAPSTVTLNKITVQVRDFLGVLDGLGNTTRPSSLSNTHSYNIQNQGWVQGNPWSATSSSVNNFAIGNQTFVVAAGLPITVGQSITLSSPYINPLFPGVGTLGGAVVSYSGTSLLVNCYALGGGTFGGQQGQNWTIVPSNPGLANLWFSAEGNYPSNADVWWYFKDSTNTFNPATTVANTSIGSNAPQGHFILNAFSQTRSVTSGAQGLSDVTTTLRPRTGTWFQGRVWYTGVDASFAATSTVAGYTWTENLYFSQVITTPADFGSCYQANDPTSEELFDLLPTDGGVITIQGCGSIYKLFPVQNGMLVFAANGVWFITGSQGIGFAATDYTVTKISNIQSISSTSFVDVLGLPYFWNEEGIYAVSATQNGSLAVSPITVGTIQSFYDSIPRSSKSYVRGAYHPIDYAIQWVYRSTEAVSFADNYTYDKILNYNTYNKAFFPYTVDKSLNSINGIIYVSYPGGLATPDPSFKYLSSNISALNTFAEEYDGNYVDWGSINYISKFVTGYKIRGQGIKKFQPQYIQVYSRTDDNPTGYSIQGIWDYANDADSNRWSTRQVSYINNTKYDVIHKRHKIRGHGYSLQFKVVSTDNIPFDIIGWAVIDTTNQGA